MGLEHVDVSRSTLDLDVEDAAGGGQVGVE